MRESALQASACPDSYFSRFYFAFPFVCPSSLPLVERNVHGMGPQSTELVAGMYNGVYCAGEALGPLIGGVLVGCMSFSWATTIIAGTLWLYVGVVAVVALRMRGHCSGAWLSSRLAGRGTPAEVAAAARKEEDTRWVPLLDGGTGGASGSRGPNADEASLE